MVELRTRRLENLTSPEIRDAIAAGIDIVLLPVGSTEQHGAHLPLSTDSLHTVAVLDRVAEALSGLVAPLLPIGRANHHMAFAGTMTLQHETFLALIRDCVDSLLSHGFRQVLIYSGHGGNAVPIGKVIAALKEEKPSRGIIGCSDFSIYNDTLFPCAIAAGISLGAAGGHAGELETSMILALAPELVRMDHTAPGFMGDLDSVHSLLMREGVHAVAPSGVLGDPTVGDADRGRLYLDALTQSITAFFQRELANAAA